MNMKMRKFNNFGFGRKMKTVLYLFEQDAREYEFYFELFILFLKKSSHRSVLTALVLLAGDPGSNPGGDNSFSSCFRGPLSLVRKMSSYEGIVYSDPVSVLY
uniref:Uncharacterized protein n=1 Tax=Cacopsylla melanoneura TaxID=428564 RepID=A0A8D8RUK8_9HEMI